MYAYVHLCMLIDGILFKLVQMYNMALSPSNNLVSKDLLLFYHLNRRILYLIVDLVILCVPPPIQLPVLLLSR